MWTILQIGTKALSSRIIRKHATHMEYVDAQEDLKSGDFRRRMKEARDERGRKIFETFSSDGLSDFLVVEMGQIQKSTMEKIRRPVQEKDGGEKTRNSR